MEYTHDPVLLFEATSAILQEFDIKKTYKIIDGTFGGGGHSRFFLKNLKNDDHLIVFDKDPESINQALKIKDIRIKVIHDSFANMQSHIEEQSIDGILFDLGVSSIQLDNPNRGFSFRYNGPLDMRMNTEQSFTAEDWLSHASSYEITKVIQNYGEERFAKRIAREIIRYRNQNKKISTTSELAMLIRKIVYKSKKDPATRTFQAIRIHVNRELEDLKNGLIAAFHCLKVNGILAVISFHSLEDRIVKRFIQKLSYIDIPRKLPIIDADLPRPLVKKINRIKPSAQEIIKNPRSSSAILRIMKKLIHVNIKNLV